MTTSHDILSSAFHGLKLSDGTPDKFRRKAELSTFLDTLEPWELWHVRALSKAKLGFADLPTLPDEIIALITRHLDHYDIAASVRVCKSWAAALQRPGVARYLLSQDFPGLLQVAADGEERQETEPSWAMYQRMVRRRALRHRGKFRATLAEQFFPEHGDGTCFTIDPSSDVFTERDLDSHSVVGNERLSRVLYSHGRVAWELADNCTVVDNLVTHRRLVIKWPRDSKMILHALSSDLAVLSNAEDRKTITLHHLERRESQSLTFPEIPYTFSVRGTTVFAIVGEPRQDDREDEPAWPLLDPNTGQITMMRETAHLWGWDVPLENVTALKAITPRLEGLSVSGRSYELSKLGVVYHPTDPSIFFLIWLKMCFQGNDDTGATESALLLGLTARKYVDAKPTSTFRTEYQLEPTYFDLRKPWFRIQFVPMNGQGDYTVASFHHVSVNKDLDRLEMRGSAVCFDTVNEQFSIIKWPGDAHRSLKDLWFDWELAFGIAQPFVWDGMVWYHLGGPCARLIHTQDEEARLKRPGTLQYLPFDDTWLERNQHSGTVWGDDRFVVIAAESGYTVFSFDEGLDTSGKGWKTWEAQKEGVLKMRETMEDYFAWLKCEERARRHRY